MKAQARCLVLTGTLCAAAIAMPAPRQSALSNLTVGVKPGTDQFFYIARDVVKRKGAKDLPLPRLGWAGARIRWNQLATQALILSAEAGYAVLDWKNWKLLDSGFSERGIVGWFEADRVVTLNGDETKRFSFPFNVRTFQVADASPDGKYLLIKIPVGTYQAQLSVVKRDGNALKKIVELPEKTLQEPGAGDSLTVSAKGDAILVTSGNWSHLRGGWLIHLPNRTISRLTHSRNLPSKEVVSVVVDTPTEWHGGIAFGLQQITSSKSQRSRPPTAIKSAWIHSSGRIAKLTVPANALAWCLGASRLAYLEETKDGLALRTKPRFKK